MSRAGLALRIAAPGIDSIRDRFSQATAGERLNPSALDPFAWFDRGLIVIPDVETKLPSPMRLFAHQREIISDYVDMAPVHEAIAEIEADVLEDDFLFSVKPRFRNLHIEKSRQMGDTWLFAGVFLWVVSFWPCSMLVTHLREKKVDDGGIGSSPKSFMGKVRYIWNRLPPEEQALLHFKYLSITNELRGGQLVGEGANSDPGRGDTHDGGLIDEASRLPYGDAAQTALIAAIREGRVYLSTPHGEDPVFYAIKESKPRSFRFHTHHWSRHPVYGQGAHIAGEAKSCVRCRNTLAGVPWDAQEILAHRYPGKLTSDWYDETNAEYDDEQVAQELDIDYGASLGARIYPEFSDPTHVWSAQQIRDRFGRDQLFDPEHQPELAWDYGADTNAVVILQDMPDSLRVCGEYEIGDSLPEDVAAAVREICADLGVPISRLEKHWTRRWFAVGDPAGESRQQATGRPLVADYRTAGFQIQSRPARIVTTIRAAKRILMGRPKPLIVDGERCPLFAKHAKMNRWPVDAQGRRKMNATEPLNDEHNHMMRAFAYYTCFKYPPPQAEPAVSSGRPPGSGRLTEDPIHYGSADRVF